MHTAARRLTLALCASALALGLTAPAGLAQKPAALIPERPSLLFSHEAARGTAAPVPGKSGEWNITLRGVPGKVLAFEDRPGRLSGSVPIEQMLKSFFGAGADESPPNASLSLTTRAGKRPALLAVELLNGRYDAKRDIVRYRVRSLVSRGKTVQIPRRFASAAVFVDNGYNARSCTANLSGGRSFDQSAPNLTLIGYDKSSHDSWAPFPPPQLDGYDPGNETGEDDPPGFYEVSWGSFEGILTFRGCTNTAGYGDQYGSVYVTVSDPYTGANTASCTASGNYKCIGPIGGFPSGGNDMEASFAVCATNDQACLSYFGQ
jgi:hypothetical protein